MVTLVVAAISGAPLHGLELFVQGDTISMCSRLWSLQVVNRCIVPIDRYLTARHMTKSKIDVSRLVENWRFCSQKWLE